MLFGGQGLSGGADAQLTLKAPTPDGGLGRRVVVE